LPLPVLTVTVRVVPGPADTLVTEAPDTPVVVRPKLLVEPPDTLSLNVTVKVTEAAFVGLVPPRVIELTVGAVTSQLTVLSVLVEAEFGFPPEVATPAAIVAMTVPLVVIPVTATLYVVPEPVTVAVVAPAVPERVTSPVAKSETDWLKTTVQLIGDVFV